jgi:modulator of FtsH protease
MDNRTLSSAASESSAIEINKVLRNTYMLLGLTIAFSAVTATMAVLLDVRQPWGLIFFVGAIISMFVVSKKANSASGLIWVFVFTGLMGASIGPMLLQFLDANMGHLIGQALGGTAVVVFSLSAYALISKKDFSFLGGFLMVGLVVALIGMIANFFFAIPAMSMAMSALIIFIMSGFILFDTSRIINGGERNYILATVGLYLNIYNIFVHLLALLGMSED